MESKRVSKRRYNSSGIISENLQDAYLFDESRLELLAYLDYGVSQKIPQALIVKDIIRHFCEERETKLSAGDIDLRLRHFWERWGPAGSKPSEYKKLFDLGSRCLPGLMEDHAKWIHGRLDILLTQKPRRLLRGKSQTPNSLLSVRSGKRPRQLEGAGRHFRTTSAQHTAVPKRQKQTWRTVSPRTLRYLTCYLLTYDGQDRTWHRSSQSIMTPTPRSTSFWSPEINIPDSQCSQSSQQDMAVSGDTVSVIPFSGVKGWQHEDRATSVDSDIGEIRAPTEAEIDYWQTRCVKAEEECHAEASRRAYLVTQLTGGNQSTMLTQHLQLRERNHALKRDLDTFRAALKFNPKNLRDFPLPNLDAVIRDMEAIRTQVRDILRGQNILFLPEAIRLGQKPDLAVLFQRSLGLQENPKSGFIPHNKILRTIKLRLVVRALVSAAICEWVFEVGVKFLFQGNDQVHSRYRALLAIEGMSMRPFDTGC